MFHLNGNEQLFNFSALTIFLSFGSHFVTPSNSPLDKSTQQKGIRRPVRILSTFLLSSTLNINTLGFPKIMDIHNKITLLSYESTYKYSSDPPK